MLPPRVYGTLQQLRPDYLGLPQAGILANLTSDHQPPLNLPSIVNRQEAMPPRNLLQLPPELLIRILTQLSLRPLLRFSLISRRCWELSNESLSHLSFGVFPDRVSERMAWLSQRDGTHCSTTVPVPNVPAYPIDESDAARLIIPGASALDRQTLTRFHNELTCKVLERYASGLRVLDLTVWYISQEVGDALSKLRGLKCLRLRVINPFHRHRLGRAYFASALERDVWSHGSLREALTNLRCLRLENVDMDEERDIAVLLEKNPALQVLVLNDCPRTANKIRTILQGLKGEGQMKELHIASYRDILSEKTIEFLNAAMSLKVRLFVNVKEHDGSKYKLIRN